jgi:RNAse (barnase) inhibitor barstar
MSDHFSFVPPHFTAEAKVALLPPGIRSESELFDELSNQLSFPSYFGRNWNALSDLLRDLSWLPQRQVAIVHQDLPQLNRDSLVCYLDVLSDAVADWSSDENHELVVVFPPEVRSAVLELLSDRK